jgi:membrane protease subunit HflC
MKRFLLYIVLPVTLLLWARTALYSVDVGEFAYVTRFGEKVAIHDGASDAGLHAKLPWPIDAVLRVDRRLQAFDLPAVEALTRDPANRTVDKTLALDAVVAWRVPDAAAADKFVRTVGTVENARRVLAPRINGRLANVVSNRPLDDLVSIEPDPAKVDARALALRAAILGAAADDLRTTLADEYGIELVDLRVRRFGYPEAVRSSIHDRIRSERARKVADYDSEGRKRAADILSAADRDARTLEAEAKAKRQLLEGQADTDADRIRNDAHAKDREFYTFLQKLKAYQALLSDTKDVLLLSSKHELFDLLLSPPKPGK